MPKLRKVAEKPKEEAVKKDEPKKTVKKVTKKPKYEELPEIPDYERPQLEVYEKSEFDPTDFSRRTSISRLEKPNLETAKTTAEPVENGVTKVKLLF